MNRSVAGSYPEVGDAHDDVDDGRFSLGDHDRLGGQLVPRVFLGSVSDRMVLAMSSALATTLDPQPNH